MNSIRTILKLLLLLLLIAGCTKKPEVHKAIWSDGTWLRDTQGRVLLFHGINVSQKVPPYLPDHLPPDATMEDVEKVFENIKSAGFNAVRLIIIWAGLEPEPGVIDTAYLDQIQQELQFCEDNGLLVLLDMHQDLYSRSLCYGDGAPEWATYIEGYDPSQCKSPWALNYTLPAVMQSFQNFWENKPGPDGVGLQDHYASVFRALAERFRDTKYLIGYEIMNEPFPGRYDLFAPEFEIEALAPFYDKVASAIREVDPDHIIAFEPSVTRANLMHDYNTGILETEFPRKFNNLVFAPHYYPLSFGDTISDSDVVALQTIFLEIADVSSRMNTPYIIGEMGLDHNAKNSAQYMVALLNELDNALAGWFFWAYRGAFSNNGEGDILLDSGGADAFPQMEALSRPYPIATAGTPLSISYPITSDPATFTTTTFTYTYKEDGIGKGLTEIFIPERHFPYGFTVTLSDGSFTFDAFTGILSYSGGKESTHTITILPCPQGSNDGCVGFK